MKILNLIVLVVLCWSCNSGYREVAHKDGQKIYNIHYGPRDSQTMDVFIPKIISKKNAFAIIIHGGAWTLGDKANIRMTQKYLLKQGIPSANINYRLANDENRLDEQLIDIASVIKMLDRDLAKYELKPKKYTLIGESSGGHIALLYGYAHPEQTSSIIALFPPTNFSREKTGSLIAKLWVPVMHKVLGKGDKKSVDQALFRASPINSVTDVPTLIIQGTWDFIVDKSQAKDLDSVLAKKKVKHKLLLVEKGTHYMRLNPRTRNKVLYPEILNWIENNGSQSGNEHSVFE